MKPWLTLMQLLLLLSLDLNQIERLVLWVAHTLGKSRHPLGTWISTGYMKHPNQSFAKTLPIISAFTITFYFFVGVPRRFARHKQWCKEKKSNTGYRTPPFISQENPWSPVDCSLNQSVLPCESPGFNCFAQSLASRRNLHGSRRELGETPVKRCAVAWATSRWRKDPGKMLRLVQ